MAEERMIDDDLNKDKKYRIRKNADGEDELYIDDSVEETFEDLPAVAFDMPEENGEITPEREVIESEEGDYVPEQISNACFEAVERAKKCIEEEDYISALKNIEEAQNSDPYDGAAWALKLTAVTRNFSEFSNVDDLVNIAEDVSKYCSDEYKAELAEKSAPLEGRIIELEERAASMHVEVEKKKTERRELFLSDRKRAVLWFSVTALPFIICLVVALAFTSVMFARQDGVNLIIMIVFASLAALFFIASLFTGRKLWAAMKKLSLNEKNSSTKLGREYESTLAEAEKLNTVLHSFKL